MIIIIIAIIMIMIKIYLNDDDKVLYILFYGYSFGKNIIFFKSLSLIFILQ
jgi:hypothetical protein